MTVEARENVVQKAKTLIYFVAGKHGLTKSEDFEIPVFKDLFIAVKELEAEEKK